MNQQSVVYHYEGYRIQTPSTISADQARSLLAALPNGESETRRDASQVKGSSGPLQGRGMVAFWTSPILGELAVKEFRRGGLLGRLISKRYFGFGKSRGEAEYDYLELVRRFGVHAPVPIAAVTTGRILYRTWLITQRILAAEHLSQLALSDRRRAEQALVKLADQVKILIDKQIFHVDLHPGNVLVNTQGEVSIIDFDKALVFRGSKSDLRDEYLRRWRRAVLKHQLPEFLSEYFFSRLCVRFDNVTGRIS